ncbi:MAG TPA: GNAT family N-acetyltransferase [Anaerolineaceae bacterium]|nr:GNAT family N-acetyltransferase [Anaerolineaceae bacterium]HQP09506.1 GNAT family N-acetyltransferase [Anaerolineaceae bacterium]
MKAKEAFMVTYTDNLEGITPALLQGGFFNGWPDAPAPQAHLRILQGSDALVLALGEDGRMVGYITAISDGVSCACIPHLEVLPAYRGKGIGKELVRCMLAKLDHLYMVDLLCDPDVQPFYESLGMQRATGMALRNYDRQNCAGVG